MLHALFTGPFAGVAIAAVVFVGMWIVGFIIDWLDNR